MRLKKIFLSSMVFLFLMGCAVDTSDETVKETGSSTKTESVQESESAKETESVTETESEKKTETETEKQTESETESATESEREKETAEETESAKETETEKETETVKESKTAAETKPTAFVKRGDAYYIIDAVYRYGANNGWNYDNRFDLTEANGTKVTGLLDVSEKKYYRMIRDFDAETEGVFRFDLIIEAMGSDDGVYIAFVDGNDKPIFGLKPNDGRWLFFGETEKKTSVSIAKGSLARYDIEMDIDLNKNVASVAINNVECGEIKIPDCTLSRLVIGTTEKGTGQIDMWYATLSKDYAVNDHFIGSSSRPGVAGWDIEGKIAVNQISSVGTRENASVKIQGQKDKTSSAIKKFDAVTGKVSMETLILLPQKTDGASVSFLCGNSDAVKFETRDGKIYVGDKMVHDYAENVWQTLHVEADTDKKTADIYVNGKKRTTISISATYFDGVKIEFTPAKNSTMWFDDVEIYEIKDHADYPAEPVVAESKDYNIGMNVCWLWRDQQSGEGWDATSAFPEFDTYLGYYDEGLRETADWEIKWMAEHGVDFINVCWYTPFSSVSAPIKEMLVSHSALHDGYMMAKYSDKLDFCIMWENSAVGCTNLEQFKKYIWSYWKEYYFSDPRYVRLDNKALMTVWSTSLFEQAFGGAAQAKKAIEFMNEDIKSLGYDGIIILNSLQMTQDRGTYSQLASTGYTGSYGYHWGRTGYDPDVQIKINRTNSQNAGNIANHVPTVSIGFNDVGRNQVRSPIISVADHLKVCKDIKNILDSRKTGTWKDNTLILSTWNEFSEGTYMFPTASTGFDYLENVRKTFTDDKTDHSEIDVKPTEAQIARVSHLYPPQHAPIRLLHLEDADKSSGAELVANEKFTFDMANGGDRYWNAGHGLNKFEKDGSALTGSSSSSDYCVLSNISSFKAKDLPTLHIRMKNDKKATYEIFFITKSDPSWDGHKRIEGSISKTGEYVDYYIDMTANKKWAGEITAIRIDPQTAAGSFSISLIELMGSDVDPDSIAVVKVNGRELELSFPTEITDKGEFVAVGDRSQGFFSALRLYHEWDRFTDKGVLTVKTSDEKTIVFKVGSDKVTVNGKEQSLGYKFEFRDGLPVFRLKKLCDLIGYKYTVKGNVIDIQAATEEELEILNSRVENHWEFDEIYETEGFTTQQCSIVAKDGFLEITSDSQGDVAIKKAVTFEARKYKKIVMAVEYNKEIASQTPQLFFSTTTAPGYSADRCINGEYKVTGTKEGDIMIVEFDLRSCKAFAGVITNLRIDPYSGRINAKIDYIHCK